MDHGFSAAVLRGTAIATCTAGEGRGRGKQGSRYTRHALPSSGRQLPMTRQGVFTLMMRGRFLTWASKFNVEPNRVIFDVSAKNNSMELAVIRTQLSPR